MWDPKGKLGLWMLGMADHQYDIVDKSGILHVDADHYPDVLSRWEQRNHDNTCA